jgi:hypothetical protein
MSLHTCEYRRSNAAREACALSVSWHNAGESMWITGRVAPAIAPIRRLILPPLTPTGVLTIGLVERVDASMAQIVADHEKRRIELLLTTGEELP